MRKFLNPKNTGPKYRLPELFRPKNVCVLKIWVQKVLPKNIGPNKILCIKAKKIWSKKILFQKVLKKFRSNKNMVQKRYCLNKM